MVNAYTKTKPDSFKLQLQAILTTYYEHIKGVQGASGCHKTRIVKDYTCNEGMDAADAAACAGAAVLPGATPAQTQLAQAAAERSLQLLHLPPALSGRREALGAKRKTTQADAD